MALSSEHGTIPKVNEPGRTLGRRWILFVAGRYLRTQRKEKRNTTAILSVLALAVGVAVLITVLSVMNAFHFSQIEPLVTVESYHLRARGNVAEKVFSDTALLREILRGNDQIDAVVPFSDTRGLAHGLHSGSYAVQLRAVPPDVLQKDKSLSDSIGMIGSRSFFNVAKPMSIVLGDLLASDLGVGPGDKINIMVLSAGEGLASPREFQFTVSGIFTVGYYDIDKSWAYISLDSARTLSKQPIKLEYGIKLKDREQDYRVMSEISAQILSRKLSTRGQLDRELVSWRQYNSAIFGALRVEKLMIMCIVGLIFIVVGVNIFQILRRSVLERTEDIGVLASLGASPASIRLVFTVEGFIIGLLGGSIGLVLGWLAASNVDGLFHAAEAAVNWIRDLFLPANTAIGDQGRIRLFFLDRVPSRLIPSEAAGIALFAFLSSTVAALAASRRVSRIRPAEILRSE